MNFQQNFNDLFGQGWKKDSLQMWDNSADGGYKQERLIDPTGNMWWQTHNQDGKGFSLQRYGDRPAGEETYKYGTDGSYMGGEGYDPGLRGGGLGDIFSMAGDWFKNGGFMFTPAALGLAGVGAGAGVGAAEAAGMSGFDLATMNAIGGAAEGGAMASGLGAAATAAAPAATGSGLGNMTLQQAIQAASGAGGIANLLGKIGGDMSLGDIAKLGGAGLDMYNQNKASDKMLDYLKGQQTKIDNLYAPGSPEYDYLMRQMEAKDAAAGRNSQYGPRSVDLAAKIAEMKARNTVSLTGATTQPMQSALSQSAASPAGLNSVLQNMLKGTTVQNLSSVVSPSTPRNGGIGASNMDDFGDGTDVWDMINGWD